MSRIKSILARTLLVAAAIPAAQGQNATPPAPQSANQSSTTPSPDGSAGRSSTAGGDAAAQGQPSQGDTADKSPGVCFKLTGHCVQGTKAPSPPGAAASTAKDGSAAKRPLNLSAPDVRTVVPAEELKEPLPSGEQVTEIQESQTVSVKGEAEVPDVPGGFGALWWALNHPSQAWRILAPAE